MHEDRPAPEEVEDAKDAIARHAAREFREKMANGRIVTLLPGDKRVPGNDGYFAYLKAQRTPTDPARAWADPGMSDRDLEAILAAELKRKKRAAKRAGGRAPDPGPDSADIAARRLAQTFSLASGRLEPAE